MASLFCCDKIKSYRPQYLSHEAKFNNFMTWASFPRESAAGSGDDTAINLLEVHPPFAVQLVRQINYGPLEFKRYFVPIEGKQHEFVEVVETALIQANFQKLNTYKNYKCDVHDRFFEVNIYQKDPVNKHHWRANLARPATSIDL
ncbi:hypothetical protein B0T10DRAFT_564325 [Thelonectria olida]|uniref:Uncharacterized protein n=1 Tax=Thelonectria olida TaxID=1576542 RepID=A0A9P9AMH9_9HYPO|nr:hypothetical protein B0T10DRAFT_564325 [Thelonectria olida]